LVIKSGDIKFDEACNTQGRVEKTLSYKTNWNAYNLLIFERCVLKNMEWIKLAYDKFQWQACQLTTSL